MSRRLYVPSVAFCFTLLCGGPLLSLPQFLLTLDAPTNVTGEPTETVDIPVTARLVSAGIDTPDGVEGWSIGLSAEGFDITAATVAGTSGALAIDGGLRLDDGFEKTQFTTGPGNTGVTSAVVLSSGTNVTLPPAGTADVLRLTLRSAVPNPVVSGGQYFCVPHTGRVFFVNGLRGSGQPVENKVSYQGIDYRPSLGQAGVSVCPRIDQPSFSLSVSAPANVDGPAGGLKSYEAKVNLGTSDNTGTDGAEGWSVSLSSQGSKIVGATVAGTAGAPVAGGGFQRPDGFERTELTSGAGNEGVVSAVALSASSNATLPPTGTQTLLRLTVEASVPQPIVAGGQFLCVPLRSEVFFVDGRKGSGQPVKNRVSYRGLAVNPSRTNASTSVCPTIITPAYTLSFTSPSSLTGAGGSALHFEAVSKLGSFSNPGPDGAEGWSLSVTSEGGRIVDATTSGTLGAPSVEGGLRAPDGFEKTELTSGAGNEGAVSAVVLSQSGGVTLPPSGSANLLRLTVETAVPQPVRGPAGEEICIPQVVRVLYRDGLKGSGQPVKNNAGYRGLAYAPAPRDAVTRVCPTLANPFKMQVSVISPEATAEAEDSGRVPWVIDVPVGSSSVPVTAGVFLTSDLEGREDGVRSWSFSVKIPDCFGFVSATTAGTAVDVYSFHGFEKTEIAEPARNGGQKGVVTAVILSQSDPRWLPPVGQELLFKLSGVLDASGISAPGQSTLACALDIPPPGTPGLRGTGEPVDTVVSIFNPASSLVESRDPDVSGAAIRLEGVAGGNLFRRGDANQDTKQDLSDAVFILSDLFRGGPPVICKDAADTNNDGKVDISDPVYLLRYLFQGTPRPPDPFAACGIDPEGAADGVDCVARQTGC